MGSNSGASGAGTGGTGLPSMRNAASRIAVMMPISRCASALGKPGQ
jgi:hypothetical protein